MFNKLAKLYDNLRKGIRPRKKEIDNTPHTVLESKKMGDLLPQQIKISATLINEDVIIAGHPEGGGEEIIGVVDNDYYKDLKHDIRAAERGGINDMVREILISSGWKTADNFERDVLVPVTNVFARSGISNEFVRALLDNQKNNDSTLNILNSKLSTHEKFNIKDIFISRLSRLTRINESMSITHIFDALWSIRPKLKNIATGPGELCLTVLSNAKKGTKGDLNIEGVGEIEMKGIQGRPGSEAYALTTSEQLFNILKKKNKSLGKGMELRKLQRSYITQYEKVQDKFNLQDTELIERLNKNKATASQINQFRFFRRQIEKLLNPKTYLPQASLNEIVSDVNSQMDNIGVSKLPIKSFLTGSNGIIKSKYNFDKMRHSVLKTEINAPLEKTKEKFLTFGNAIQNFFLLDWGLSKDELIEGLLAARNHKLSTEQLDTLENELNEFFSSQQNLSNLSNSKFLGDVIITLHNVCYQIDHEFPYLLLINDKSKNALAIDFTEGGNMFSNVFNQIHNNNIVVGWGLDKMWKNGVQMTLAD